MVAPAKAEVSGCRCCADCLLPESDQLQVLALEYVTVASNQSASAQTRTPQGKYKRGTAQQC